MKEGRVIFFGGWGEGDFFFTKEGGIFSDLKGEKHF